VFNVTLKELPENSPTFVRRLFWDVLKNLKQKMEASSNDYLRVIINHPSLDSPVWVEYTQSKNLNEDKILNKIQAVQQSKKEFVLSDGGPIWTFSRKVPQGSGGNAQNIYTWTRKKLKTRREPLCRLLTPEILCVCSVPS
jgi:hypothetical protein